MATKELAEFFKAMHEHELDRMDKLDAALALPAGVITVLFGVASYYSDNLPSADGGFLCTVFYVAFGVFLVLLIMATLFLIASVFRGRVVIPAQPREILEWTINLRAFFADAQPAENLDRLVDEQVREKLMVEEYVKYATKNQKANLRQYSRLYWARLCMCGSIVALLLSAGPFFVLKERTPDGQKVRILEIPKLDVSGPE